MATEADLAAFTAASGRDWDQLCQAWIWNICDTFGRVVATPASAIDAYYASGIVSADVWSAPPGSIVYMDIGAYGHVLTIVDDGTGMASARVEVFWGINAGETSLADYLAQTGATPLGWGWDNAGNTYPYQSSSGPIPGPDPKAGEDEMYVYRNQNDGACYMVGRKRIKHLGSGTDLSRAKTLFPYYDVDDGTFRVGLIALEIPYDKAVRGADWSGI